MFTSAAVLRLGTGWGVAVAVALAASAVLAAPPNKRPAKEQAEAADAVAEQVGKTAGGSAETVERLPPGCELEVLFEHGQFTALEYARQLDYFGIELGAIAKNGQIQYASHLSQPRPERRIGKKSEEQRMTITWKRGNLSALDGKLLTKAGITTTDKTFAHFYPIAVETRLLKLQKAYAGHDAGEIRRTRFKIRSQTSDPQAFEFYVTEQDLRDAPAGRSANSAAAPSDK
jgi:hypothetical protein